MTIHEAQALVIAAVGDLPEVTRIDYVVDAGGAGVVVTCGEKYWATLHAQLEEMTVEEYRTTFLCVLANTQRHVAQATAEGREA